MNLSLRKRLSKWMSRFRTTSPTAPIIMPPIGPRRFRVLFSYLSGPVAWPEDDQRFMGHSNAWESRAIAHLLRKDGCEVVAIDWNNTTFIPQGPFHFIFDINDGFARWPETITRDALNWLHLTGSDPDFQNKIEIERAASLTNRRGQLYLPRRIIKHTDLARTSRERADFITLIGNDVTLSTYPHAFRNRISKVPVSGSYLGSTRKIWDQAALSTREFLWFFGRGLVLKGLDITLEVFASHPEWQLHICGPLETEPDFMKIFSRELSLPNIHVHGYQIVSSPEFQRILTRCAAFIAPSFSEGIAPSVVTCLQLGLYPIISRHTGVDLPANSGIWLEPCEPQEIERAATTFVSMNAGQLMDEVQACRSKANAEYSRTAFLDVMGQQWDKVKHQIQHGVKPRE